MAPKSKNVRPQHFTNQRCLIPLPSSELHWNEVQRYAMQTSILAHIQEDPPNRDLGELVPVELRRIPPRWAIIYSRSPAYYCYRDFAQEAERQPNGIDKSTWTDWTSNDAILEQTFELLIFWHGPLELWRIPSLLPQVLLPSLTYESVSKRNQRIKAILGLNNTIFDRVIGKLIKPITMRFLLNSKWMDFAPNGLPHYPFEKQKDRLRYFEGCLEPWMVPYWLYISAPNMINIHWLYQSREYRDFAEEHLRKALCRMLQERFLRLVDATYIYLIDQSLGVFTPIFDQRKQDLMMFMTRLDERMDPELGPEKDVIRQLPVWGPGVPQNVENLWTHGIISKPSIVLLNSSVAYDWNKTAAVGG